MKELKEFYAEVKKGIDNQKICIDTYCEIFKQYYKILKRFCPKDFLKSNYEIGEQSAQEISDLLSKAIKNSREAYKDFLRLEELIALEEDLDKNKPGISSSRRIFNSFLSTVSLYTPLIVKAFYETVQDNLKIVFESLFKKSSNIIDYSSSIIGSLTTFAGIMGLSYIGSKILNSNNFVSGFSLNTAIIGLSSAISFYSMYLDEFDKNYEKLKEGVMIANSKHKEF